VELQQPGPEIVQALGHGLTSNVRPPAVAV
jgi:hypothetical protein